MIGLSILLFITFQRLIELLWARRNTHRLIKAGAKESFPGHYPLIVALHASWLFMLYLSWISSPPLVISPVFLAGFVLLTAMRAWVLINLGARFTTRIIAFPTEPLVTSGPYRFIRHPNYMVVMGEIICVPLIFGWWKISFIWGSLNALLLWHRIRCENKANEIV